MDERLIAANTRAIEEGKRYVRKRFLYDRIKNYLGERVYLGLVGPRGAGKTILLKQLLNESQTTAFYISLEENPVSSLFDIVEELEGKNYKILLLDEVQFYPQFDLALKTIYESTKIKIIFTSSIAIELYKLSADISRRVRLQEVPPLSYREYLFFSQKAVFTEFILEDLGDIKRCEEFEISIRPYNSLFEEYLKGRNLIFSLDVIEPIPLYRNIIDKVINHDLVKAQIISQNETITVQKVLEFIGSSPAESVSFSSVAKNIGITKYLSEKYLRALEKSFIINLVFPKGTNVLKEPKVTMMLPYRLIYSNFDSCLGSLKEDFFVGILRFTKYERYYLKSTEGRKTPDYVVGDNVIEIGGTAKGRTQFKGFEQRKKWILTYPVTPIDDIRRPLTFAGFLY
ncbi:ATP-binding protein [Candidatus Micrarchaeota archaeon]|nr:ATP-binding protein [Candidatus Micrarchaeota archaeon]